MPRHPEWSSSSSLTSADSPLGLQAKRTSWQLLDDSRWPRTQCRLYNVLAGTRASCSPETPLQGTEPLRSALRSFSASRLNGCDLPCDLSAGTEPLSLCFAIVRRLKTPLPQTQFHGQGCGQAHSSRILEQLNLNSFIRRSLPCKRAQPTQPAAFQHASRLRGSGLP